MSRRRRSLAGLAATVAALALPAVASADCTIPGRRPDPSFDGPPQDFDGTFDASLQGAYVQIPFSARPERPRSGSATATTSQPAASSNTLDIGVYEPLAGRHTVYGPAEQRGWSGSAVKDLAIAVNGFSPAGHVRGAPQGVRPPLHDPRLPAGPDPGRNLGGRARARLDRRAAHRPRRGRLAGAGRDQHQPRLVERPLLARALRRQPGERGLRLVRGRRPRPRRAGARELADAGPRSTTPSSPSRRAAPGWTSSGSSTTTTTSTRARSAATRPTIRAS